MSAATALIHGLAMWQQACLVALFAMMFGWALIATLRATRPKLDQFTVTPENVESQVREWLDNFNVPTQKLPESDFYFGYLATSRNTHSYFAYQNS